MNVFLDVLAILVIGGMLIGTAVYLNRRARPPQTVGVMAILLVVAVVAIWAVITHTSVSSTYTPNPTFSGKPALPTSNVFAPGGSASP